MFAAMVAANFSNIDVLMLVVIFVLLIILIFLSAAEMGLSRMTKPKAASLADKGQKAGRALVRLVSDPERWVNPLLLTVNICQTVQATLTGIVAGRLFG
ncbi:MAG: CNNM domain-containing protein, partial [Ilumatobacteraceae bacterium]